eukprot:1090345-Amorphochlora_amoeboformis.AAC.1
MDTCHTCTEEYLLSSFSIPHPVLPRHLRTKNMERQSTPLSRREAMSFPGVILRDISRSGAAMAKPGAAGGKRWRKSKGGGNLGGRGSR